MTKIFLIIFFLTFLFLPWVKAEEGNFWEWNRQENYSQQIFLKAIAKKIPKERPNHWQGKKNWLSSTLIPNLNPSTKESLKKKGFKQYQSITPENYKFKYYYSPGNRPDGEAVAIVGGLAAHAEHAGGKSYGLPLRKYLGYGVILMENVTSKEWGLRNHHLIMTAMESGIDLYLRLKHIREKHPEIKKLHLIGLSLGGNDSLFSAAIDQKFVEIGNQRVIDGSIINFGSPMDRVEAMGEIPYKKGGAREILKILFKDFYAGNKEIFEKYTQKNYKEIFLAKNQTEIQENIFVPVYKLSFQNPKSYLKTMMCRFRLWTYSDLDIFLKLNSPETIYDDVKVPVLWVNAVNDKIVGPKTVTNFLLKRKHKSSTQDVLLLAHGGHIGFAHSYGKTWIRKMADAYFAYWREAGF